MEIQVDFEGRNPQDPDYHGIKTLLQQLFLKAHLDLGSLTDLIITQNYVGSVVKQSQDDEPGSEDDEEDGDANDIFGITTVINVSDRQVRNSTFNKNIFYLINSYRISCHFKQSSFVPLFHFYLFIFISKKNFV